MNYKCIQLVQSRKVLHYRKYCLRINLLPADIAQVERRTREHNVSDHNRVCGFKSPAYLLKLTIVFQMRH